jgi:hypothetical protein
MIRCELAKTNPVTGIVFPFSGLLFSMREIMAGLF